MIPLFGKAIADSAGKVIAQKTGELLVDYMGKSYSDNMQDLKRKWELLNDRASDIEEQVKSAEMSGKKKRKREVKGWLKEVKKLKPAFAELEARGSCRKLPLMEDPVGKLQNQVKELIEQSNHFDGFVLDVFDNIGEPMSPTKLFGENTKHNLWRIWPCLVTDDISNIGIYGMGGVGKTTLAKHIKYHLLEKNYQVFWVTVSQEFSINGLQDKIANVLGVRLLDKDEEEVRANILRGAMRKMGKFVLILDDVWVEFCVERIGISLGASKCRLILTTRSLEVCYRMDCQRRFEVNTLGANESWDLFKYTLCLRSTELLADIEEIAKSVTRRCGGLPLGIITVAGSMRGVRDICEWRNTLEQLKACSEGHDKMGSDVFPILEWSYSRLNDCQKHCFLYCCLYPEDAHIPREELINIFICAELMDRRSTRNLEIDQGHAILNHLIRVCLLEEFTDGSGNKYVKMHDLIRDMALRITSGKNSLETTKDAPRFLVSSVVVGERFSKIKSEQKEEWREDLSAVSINLSFGTERLGIPMDMSPNCPNLSTLLFQHSYSKSPPFDTIPSSFFNQMRGLKVLKLKVPFIKQLPDIISDMVNLTALLLSYCSDLAFVPPLGKLSQLRILNLYRTKIEDIPEGLERLFNLEIICLDQTMLKRIPKGTLSKLRCLQQLRLDDRVVVDDPEVLNQLEVFYGCLSSVDVYNQYINFERLKHYQIKVGERNYFSNPNTEKELVFSGCNFHGGSNVGRVRLLPQDIKELTLHSCIGMDKCISDVFPTFSSSNELSYLTIQVSAEVEFLLKLSSSPPDEPVMSPCGPFQKLRILRLLDLPNFIELFNWDSKALHRHLPPGTFSSLRELVIFRCQKMRKLFTVQLLQNLQNLDGLNVSDCEELEEIAADDIEVGSGGGCIQSTSAVATNTLILPKLRALCLRYLPKLKNICKGTIICNSIESIWVNCPKVKRLPLFPPSPPSTRFKIYGTKKWWESLEWDNPNSKNALDPFFRDWEICQVSSRLCQVNTRGF